MENPKEVIEDADKSFDEHEGSKEVDEAEKVEEVIDRLRDWQIFCACEDCLNISYKSPKKDIPPGSGGPKRLTGSSAGSEISPSVNSVGGNSVRLLETKD